MKKQDQNGEGRNSKAKLKQPKPLTNARGKSVPQERPSNSQDGSNQQVAVAIEKFN
jgi:hypothetical protein